MKKYYNIAKKLFPLNRSLTGEGVRKTLNIIKREFPRLQLKKIKSGKKVFDWNIPAEWNVADAYVIDKYNNKIIDFRKNNLHLVGYSIAVKKYFSKKELFRNFYFCDINQKQFHIELHTIKEAGGFAFLLTNIKN